MYARRVGESVAPYYSFVGLYRHVHEARYHAAYACDACGVYVGVDAEFLMGAECHNHFLKGCVACAFAYAVDCDLGLPGSVYDT